MKKTAALLIALLLAAFALVSCGDAQTDENPASGSSEAIPEPEPVEYDIVYYRFYADEADMLAAEMESRYGRAPQVIKFDQNKTMPEHAVYLGEVTDGTGSELCKSVKKRDYGVKTEGENIYVYGGSKEAVKQGVEYFIGNCLAEKGVSERCDYLYEYVYILEGATVGGAPLTQFEIVYSPTDNEAKYQNVAAKIKSYFDKNADFTPRTGGKGKQETECEILLGCDTGRETSDKYHEADYDYDQYHVEISGTKVAITGGNACAVWHGFAAFTEYLISHGNAAEDVEFDGTCTLVKVACVGDSITIGINSSDPYVYTYPNYLQEMLGYDYLVKNYGASGYSVVYTDDYAYSKHPFYRQSQTFCPDVVIWMLGTNDGNPGQAYKEWEGTNRREKYIKSADDMFAAYENVNPDVQIFVCIPAPLFESTVWPWEAWTERIEKYVLDLNRELAEKHGYRTIDIYSWSLDNQSVFPDGLHPKDATYEKYARRVYDEIADYIKTPEDIK
ncbi:MAG: hypothetical protein IJK33_06675 [Clostridia bacterium]|nr:hypothetical protein [Clostridia bacterium]